jgi:hypothetical protein
VSAGIDPSLGVGSTWEAHGKQLTAFYCNPIRVRKPQYTDFNAFKKLSETPSNRLASLTS